MKALGVVVLLLVCAGGAFGREGAAKRQAKALYEEGMKQYRLGDFAQALDAFKQAYLSHPDPTFLFDIGQCYRKLGQPAQAAEAYKNYLRDRPDADNRADIERLIAEEEARARSAAPLAATPAEARPATAAPLPIPPAPSAPPAAPPLPPLSRRRSIGITLTLAGATLAIAGAGLLGYGIVTGRNENGAGTVDERDHLDALSRATTISGGVLLGAGALALVGGIVALTLPARSPARAAIHLDPIVGSSFTGLSLEGSF